MKILIIKLGALGDIIISSSVTKKILEHHKQDEVQILTAEIFSDLFSHYENLNVTSFSRSGIINTLKAIAWIRKQKFDRIYDLQSNDRTQIFCAFSGAPYRVGNHPHYPYHYHPEEQYIGQCHSFDRLNQIIGSVNIDQADAVPYLPVSQQKQNEIGAWLEANKLTTRPYVVLHAGSSPVHKKKRWPYYEELALTISKSMEIVWAGGKDDMEINKSLSKRVGINATNKFDIFGLVELGKHAKFAITNDSAPMHILSCSQIPVFGLFGPTYPRRTHALGQFNNVISPDRIIAKNDQEFIPSDISNISLENVLSKVKEQGLL